MPTSGASALLLLLAVALTAGAVYLQWRLSRQIRSLGERIARTQVWLDEQERMQHELEQWLAVQRTTEQTIATGTEVVRTLHLGIASIPFGILEAIPVTRDTTRIVRSVHDQISNTVYDAIEGTNKLLGSVLRVGLDSSRSRRDTPTEALRETPALPPPDPDKPA